jgi:Transcriptional regulator, AbiEi antitoxin
MSNAVCHSSVAPRPRDDTHPDVRLARIAREQHGVVSIGQLAACGLDRAAVRRRTGKGRLHRVHRGVYAVGHDALTTQASFVAAVLACGDGAVLSHHAAAAYWCFRRWDGRSPQVTVTGAQRRVAGLRVHRARRLDRRDVMRRDGILVTSPARTLLDLAADLRPRELRRAARQAPAERHVNVRQLADVLTRAGGHRGAGALRGLVADGPAPTRSELEDIVLDLLDSAGIARPDEHHVEARRAHRQPGLPVARTAPRRRGRWRGIPRGCARPRARRRAPGAARGARLPRPAHHLAAAVRHPRQTLARIRAALRR